MLVAEIDRDYINERTSSFYRVGRKFELTEAGAKELFPTGDVGPKVRFRCLDDDRNVYYGGWLYNDKDCEVQNKVCWWATRDAGAIHIQVKNDEGEWRYEIG